MTNGSVTPLMPHTKQMPPENPENLINALAA